MEIKIHAERTQDGWCAEVPGPEGFTVNARRLDQCKDLVVERIKTLAEQKGDLAVCDIVIKVEAELPGIICDLEAAKVKMLEAQKLQDEASSEIRAVVSRMRDEGLTMRDIAVLLGVSPQRVAQLIG
jgi:DNA-directed RNA polymerase specialized sigma24 family protein